MTKSLRAELLIVLTLTFGISGVRAVLNLINSLASPQRLDEQSVTLNSSQSSLAWVDMGLSLIHISEPTRRTERSRMPSSA